MGDIPNKYWLFLLIAACFEVCWMYSLRALNFPEIATLRFPGAFTEFRTLMLLLPLAGYIAFGVGNVYFFSLAMQKVPASTAFAVWTGIVLAAARVIDHFWFHELITLRNLFFLLLIALGIIGLKISA